MSKFQHHFTPLSPATTAEENAALIIHRAVPFITKSQNELMIRYLGDPLQIRIIAVTATQEAANHPDFSKWMKQIVETSLTAIRLSVDAAAEPIYNGDGFLNLMYEADDPLPIYPAVVSLTGNPDYVFDFDQMLGVYQAIANRTVAPIAALLAEAQMPAVPPHYRVLSLVRAVELLFPDESERSSALDRFNGQFQNFGVSTRPLRNALPEIRNRCAHGRGRGRNDPEPFVGIGYNEATLIPLARLLRSIVAYGLIERHGLQMGGMVHVPENLAT